ncbi:MAG TPA: hypothetical protein VD902_03790 [Symbiobacteriaceae bacterium]|nr:hypothetical protein [Symbiobacteriaceae bacterium]
MDENPVPVPSDDLGRLAFQLFLCLFLTLVLGADWLAVALAGWHITFLADARIQAVWATLLELVGVCPLFAMALRRSPAGVMGLIAGVAVTGVYGLGLYLTFGRPAMLRHDTFAWQGVATTAATLFLLAEGLLRRYRLSRRT